MTDSSSSGVSERARGFLRPVSKSVLYNKEQLGSLGFSYEASSDRLVLGEPVSGAISGDLTVEEGSITDQQKRSSLEEEVLTKSGIVYSPDSRRVRAGNLYKRALAELTHDEPARVEELRGAIKGTLEGLNLPNQVDSEDEAKEVVRRVVEGMGRIGEKPSDLQRLLYDQGAKYFPAIDKLEVWALRDEGDASKKNLYWEHVFTDSKDREEEIKSKKLERQYLVREGILTRFFGKYKALLDEGSFFWSTSQKNLQDQDKRGWFVGEDDLLLNAALYTLEVGKENDNFTRKNLEAIKKVFLEYGELGLDEILEKQKRRRAQCPTLESYMSSLEIPVLLHGRIVGLVKATYRMKRISATEGISQEFEVGPNATSVLRTMVLDSESNGSNNVDEWLVDYMRHRSEEYFRLINLQDSQGRKLFPVPTYEELEKDPNAWHRLHPFNNHQRYVYSQKLRDWILGKGVEVVGERGSQRSLVFKGKKDQKLEEILGETKREEIVRALKEKRDGMLAADSLETFVPKYLESCEGVMKASSDLKVVFGRLLMSVMREKFSRELGEIEKIYGPQREFTREDMDAVVKELERTEPDKVAVIAGSELVDALAPYIIPAIQKISSGSRISSNGLERRLEQGGLIGQVRAGYEYLGKLGEGAMGFVYKARQIGPQRTVALKVLSAINGAVRQETQLRRFNGESVLGGKLNHPNIVRVYDSGEKGDIKYIALELMEGGTLQSRIDKFGKLDWRDVHKALVDISGALSQTEERKIVHRDIKPDNIMADSEGNFKLADFGLALERSNVSVDEDEGNIVGTPMFMAPEQLAGSLEIDTRSDFYALGATMYNALAGKTPYQAEDVVALFRKRMMDKEDPESLSNLRPDVPKPLIDIIEKLMQRNPDDRYQTSGELLEDLERIRPLLN